MPQDLITQASNLVNAKVKKGDEATVSHQMLAKKVEKR